MKYPLLLACALTVAACDKITSLPDATPVPATPAALVPAPSPTPKPGAWMWNNPKTSLDRSNPLDGKSGSEQKKR
jgi:hypothetical protein